MVSPRRWGFYLAQRFAQFRWRHLVALALLGLIMGALPTAVATTHASALAAIDSSIRGDLGHRAFVLDATGDDVRRLMASLSDAAPVTDSTGLVTVEDSALPVLVRATPDAALHLGHVVAGRYPARAGEATLPRSAAAALGVTVGDTVSLSWDGVSRPGVTRPVVVGLTVDPADPMSSSMSVVVAADDPSVETPNRWLSDRNFADVGVLVPYLERRTALVGRADSVAETATAQAPPFVRQLGRLPWLLGVTLLALAFAVVTAFVRLWRVDAAGLVAAGLSPRAAWKVISAACTAVIVSGYAAGVLASQMALWAFRIPLSRWLGQEWIDVRFSPLVSVAVLAACLVAAVGAPAFSRVARVRRLPVRSSSSRISSGVVRVAACLAVAAFLVQAVVLFTQDSGAAVNLAHLTAPWTAVVLALFLPFLCLPLVARTLPVGMGRLLRRLGGSALPIVALASALAVGASVWAGQTTRDATMGARLSSPLVPAGSFVVSSAPTGAVDALTTTYERLGGRQARRFGLLDEQVNMVRSAPLQFGRCLRMQPEPRLRSVPEECFTGGEAPLNTVAVDATITRPVADPNIIENGSVDVLRFTEQDDRVTGIDQVNVSPDGALGGNLPGLVLPAGSPQLKSWNMKPLGTEMVAFLDYSDLSPENRLRFRAAVARLAPAAETADGTAPTEYDRLRTVADVVSFTGALAAALVLAVGGASMVLGLASTRRLVADLGATPRRRAGLVVRWGVCLVAPVVSLVLVVVVLVSTSFRIPISLAGLTWLLPLATVLVGTMCLGVAMARPPRVRAE